MEIPEFNMPENFMPLTEREISLLRIKIGKSHRTEKDWAYIRELLRDKVVFTAEPMHENFKKMCSVEGILKDNRNLLIFSTMELCGDYLEKYGSARFGYQLTMGAIPFNTVVMIASEREERVLLDLNCPQNSNILGFDGREKTLRIVRAKH